MSSFALTPAIDLLDRLVAFDTTSRNSNLALIDFIADRLSRLGVPFRLSYNPDRSKANLHARIGPDVAGGVALSGHVDTVPVDGQAWTGDPFALRRQDGKLFARGACDMKGFVAACLALVPELVGRTLARPVHLFITYDEEITCDGARRLIETLDDGGARPAVCVVGEPSSMQPILAHKGKLDLRVTVRGRTGHSSTPALGVNAVQAAAEAIAWVAAEARRMAAEGPFEDGFDPPCSTVHVGTVSGGTILNIIPELARFTMEWRTIPADDPHVLFARLRDHVARAIEPAMHAVDPASGFAYELTAELPGMSLPPAHPLADLVRHLTGANHAGKVSYGTEGGFYQNAGIPTIICGPGDIAQAHKPDEFVTEEQMVACDRFLRRLIDRLTG
ncbi:MAG TPA: acetylornithine deacetylase [Acetobacteraceae bacterium]|nr:acetylornithine deacetylase [Acetobacteraceae bacterium]